MKARPILFSAPMVLALLAGRKTQTRRIMKAQTYGHKFNPPHPIEQCPYGQPGDLLWVRESAYVWNAGCKDGSGLRISYRATEPDAPVAGWTPSIHMYRFASRLTLEITGVRVERLQDITPHDAGEEGIFTPEIGYANLGERAPVIQYGKLWESINGAGSWDANPWVWVIEFSVHKENIDKLLKMRAA